MITGDIFHVLRRPDFTRNWLVTIALGDLHYATWKRHALPSWLKYCERNDIGLLVFTHSPANRLRLPDLGPPWQRLLIGSCIEAWEREEIERVCYLDTDTLINPQGSNVFFEAPPGYIASVSIFGDSRESYREAQRRIGCLRRHWLSDEYPLDSVLNLNPLETFELAGYPPQRDFFAGGILVFEPSLYSLVMRDVYLSAVKRPTHDFDADCQLAMNYSFQNIGIEWLDSKYETLWLHKLVMDYPFLYVPEFRTRKLVASCVASCLSTSVFLHFAGTWPESNVWRKLDWSLVLRCWEEIGDIGREPPRSWLPSKSYNALEPPNRTFELIDG